MGASKGPKRKFTGMENVFPIMPTENRGIMSGPMRKPRSGKRRIDKRGSRRGSAVRHVTMRDPETGRKYGGRVVDGVPQFKKPDFVSDESFNRSFPSRTGVKGPRRVGRRGGRRPSKTELMLMARRDGNLPKKRFEIKPTSSDYGPKKGLSLRERLEAEKSGVRYTADDIPTAVQQTERVPVQDPTLGGPPEREIPIPKERLPKITRESDPRGGAPFSPDERGAAKDRFFERMFERADERRQQRSMQREERGDVRRSFRDERMARRNQPGEIDVGGEIDINSERGGRRRRGGGMRRRGGRRRDFTRKRSQMEGGRRGRSREERAAFRDRYVSTLR